MVIGYLLVCGSTFHCVCGSGGLADSLYCSDSGSDNYIHVLVLW